MALELFLLPGNGQYRAFIAGAVVASVWQLLVRMLEVARYPGSKGADGEDRTRELVDHVPAWLTVHDLPFPGWNVDHVVVTPLAVLAIQTK